jgi:hypothetical protein
MKVLSTLQPISDRWRNLNALRQHPHDTASGAAGIVIAMRRSAML